MLSDANPPLPPGAWVPLVVAVVLSLLMVVAMVEWSKALLFSAPSADSEAVARRRRLWGGAYFVLWAGIILAFVRFIQSTGGPVSTHNTVVLCVAVGGWWAVHAAIIWFGRALQKAAARQAPPENDFEEGEFEEAVADESESTETDTPASRPQPEAAPAPPAPPARSRSGDTLRLIRNIGIVLAVIAVVNAITPLKDAGRAVDERRGVLLAVTISMAVVGTLLLVAGGVRLVLRRGEPMTREEIEAQTRNARAVAAGPAVYRKSAHRHFGPVVGMKADNEVSFAEMKEAWRDRAWRYSPRWRTIFLMAAGALLMSLGIAGVVFTVAPAGIKVIVVAVVAYATVRTISGFRRA